MSWLKHDENTERGIVFEHPRDSGSHTKTFGIGITVRGANCGSSGFNPHLRWVWTNVQVQPMIAPSTSARC